MLQYLEQAVKMSAGGILGSLILFPIKFLFSSSSQNLQYHGPSLWRLAKMIDAQGLLLELGLGHDLVLSLVHCSMAKLRYIGFHGHKLNLLQHEIGFKPGYVGIKFQVSGYWFTFQSPQQTPLHSGLDTNILTRKCCIS